MVSLSKKIFWIVVVIAVSVVAIVLLTDTKQKSTVIDYEDKPFLGEEAAPVEIVEFGDYKCPACKDFNENVVPFIYEELVETGKAKFYYMHYSFLAPDSDTSAEFAEVVYQELGNDTFWEFHDNLLASQETEANFTDDVLESILSEIASPEETEQVVVAYENGEGKDAWDEDMETAKNLGVTSTPSIYIGGEEFTGRTMEDFVNMVEEQTANGK